MRDYDKRVFGMLERLVVFSKTYPKYFTQPTLAGQAMAEIEAAVQQIAAFDTSLHGGQAAVKTSASERIKARTELRDYLETISKIAKGLKLGQFSMPRDRSDATLVSVGKMWAEYAAPLKQTFIDSGLTDFTERLNAAVEKVSRAIQEQTFSKGSRLAAASALAQTMGAALAALQRLDPIITNQLRSDPPAQAVWERARRVERPSRVSPPPAGDRGPAKRVSASAETNDPPPASAPPAQA